MESETDLKTLKDLLRIAPGFFGYICAEGKVLCLNDTSLHIVGAEASEVAGQNFWEGPWWKPLPQSSKKVRQAIERAQKGETSNFDIQYHAKPAGKESEETRWSEINFTPCLDQSGDLERIAVKGVDVTERVHSQMELATERQKLEMIFEKTPAAMATWRGPDLVFELVNPEYQKIFSKRQLVGLPLLEAIPELKGQPFADYMKEVLKTGRPYVAREALARIPNDDTGELEDRYYDFVYSQITDSEGRPYGVYDHAIEVTERVRNRKAMEESQEQLRESVEMLQKARKLRENLAAALSHDLRTPLTVVQSSADLLEASSESPETKKLAKVISDNVERADKMIQDILTAGQITSGGTIAVKKVRCDLYEIAAQALKDLKIVHGDRFVLKGDKDVIGFWDASALRRVVENFANNAVKYGSLDQAITVTVKKEGQKARLCVHNHGDPIALEEQREIFQAYKRSQHQAGQQKGWGIGLTLVWGIAKAHDGEAIVKSGAGEGTTFCIKIPLGKN